MCRARDGQGTHEGRPWDCSTGRLGGRWRPQDFRRQRVPLAPGGFAAMDTGPIVNMFTQLITVGTTIALIVCAFFVMLAGYQYMTAGGSVRAIESAKGSLSNAFIGLAIAMLCRVLANLVGGALHPPTG